MIIIGLLALGLIFLLYKLFIGGWLFKLILFFFGWIGLHLFLVSIGFNTTALTFGNPGTPVSWAILIPTVVCLLCLLSTHTD